MGLLGGRRERRSWAAHESLDRSRGLRRLPRPGSSVPEARPGRGSGGSAVQAPPQDPSPGAARSHSHAVVAFAVAGQRP
jgi:hypothetical protein